jgi:putative transposase
VWIIQRWVYIFTVLIEGTFRKRKKAVGKIWRMDETYIKVKGDWMYLYRAVDKEGNTVDFLLTKRRNKYAAHKFLINAIKSNGCSRLINIDQSYANKGAIKTYNKRTFSKIRIIQCKYLNNRVEGDHQFIQWRVQNMPGSKYFESTCRKLIEIERVRMTNKE